MRTDSDRNGVLDKEAEEPPRNFGLRTPYLMSRFLRGGGTFRGCCQELNFKPPFGWRWLSMHGVGHKVWRTCKMSEVSPALREKI